MATSIRDIKVFCSNLKTKNDMLRNFVKAAVCLVIAGAIIYTALYFLLIPKFSFNKYLSAYTEYRQLDHG